ncbi:hypothetical protein EVA_09366 [gut metagenome]|uniref:Uncharacterized protein n=1 Tax=gut metagenome TaxID=749906 RepID=J9CQT6_9ZZZZ
MGLFYKLMVVFYVSACVGVLQNAGEEVGCELEFAILAGAENDALRYSAGSHYGQGLGEDTFIDEDHVGSGFLLCPAAQGVHHADSFGCCRGFVE